jgi:DNA polymerase-3 subunit gamma/tau
MSPQVFYRKWRSQTLAELVGQPHVTQTILNALKSGNISHAYLFCGPRGTGKTSTARILAKAVNCLNNGKGEPCNECEMCRAITEDRAMDVIEIDAASNRGIDDIRDLREKVNYAPTQARRKVYIIDEFHMLSKDASNALLKTLEEPPPHVIFVLATTEAHKVLPTILSRCQHFDFHRLSRTDVVAKLSLVCTAEKIDIDPQSLQLIARASTGSLRDAYNLLEQLTTYYGNDVKYAQVQAMLGITGDARAKEILKHIVNQDISAGMATLVNVSNDGLDLHQFNRELVEYLRALLLIKTGAGESVDLTSDDVAELKELSDKATLPGILNAIKSFGQIDLGTNVGSSLPMELALVECFLNQDLKNSPASKPEEVPQAQTKPVTAKISPPQVKTPISKSETVVQPPAKTGNEPVSNAEPRAGFVAASKTTAQSQPAAETAANVVKETPAAAPALSSEIERLKLNWKQVIENSDAGLKRTAASALLKSGSKPVAIEGETIVLSFGFKIHKENMEKPENKRIAEQIIGNYLGHPCQISCVCDPKKDHLVNMVKKLGAQEISVEEK